MSGHIHWQGSLYKLATALTAYGYRIPLKRINMAEFTLAPSQKKARLTLFDSSRCIFCGDPFIQDSKNKQATSPNL